MSRIRWWRRFVDLVRRRPVITWATLGLVSCLAVLADDIVSWRAGYPANLFMWFVPLAIVVLAYIGTAELGNTWTTGFLEAVVVAIASGIGILAAGVFDGQPFDTVKLIVYLAGSSGIGFLIGAIRIAVKGLLIAASEDIVTR